MKPSRDKEKLLILGWIVLCGILGAAVLGVFGYYVGEKLFTGSPAIENLKVYQDALGNGVIFGFFGFLLGLLVGLLTSFFIDHILSRSRDSMNHS